MLLAGEFSVGGELLDGLEGGACACSKIVMAGVSYAFKLGRGRRL